MSIRIRRQDLAFSSTWLGDDAGRPGPIIQTARSLGISRVALGPDLREDPPQSLAARLKEEEIQIVSLQNVSAAPGGPDDPAGGENLADPRTAVRDRALRLIQRSIHWAKRLGTSRLILHLGCVNMERLKEIHGQVSELLTKEGKFQEAGALIREGRALMAAHMEAYLDRIIRILHALLKDEPEMTFCIENPAAFFELPDLQSLEFIFEDIRSPRLAFWFNTGWAHIQEKLGQQECEAWPGKFGSRTVGIYLHDVVDLEEGLPPGMGEIDFKGIRDLLPASAVKVIKAAPTRSLDELKLAVEALRSMGF